MQLMSEMLVAGTLEDIGSKPEYKRPSGRPQTQAEMLRDAISTQGLDGNFNRKQRRAALAIARKNGVKA